MKIENTMYTSFQNNTLLFINGLSFDIMNCQNNQSLEFEWIPMLKPLRSVRFSWFRSVLLKSFHDWLNSVQQCQGNFTNDAGHKMFIPWQTYGGLKISVNWINEATQFFFDKVKYVLTERFCQDPLENWFGRQRSLGSRGMIIQVWFIVDGPSIDITIMLLETKKISNQSLTVILLLVAWLS